MSAPLTGRDAEQDRVAALLDASPAGLAVAFVEGEAGVGKSALARAVADRARERGWQVLRCSPTQAEAGYAYAALADLVGPVATPEALAAVPEVRRRALLTAVRLEEGPAGGPVHADVPSAGAALHHLLLTAGRERPVLVLVDDVQWLDSATAGVLGFALRRVDAADGARVAVLVTRRASEPGALPLDLDRSVAPDATVTLWLDGLGPTALHEVVAARLGVRLGRPLLHRLHALCRGNPFYALQIVQSLLARHGGVPADADLRLPESLAAIVDERIAQTDAALRTLLLVVSALAVPTPDRLREALDGMPGPVAAEGVEPVLGRAEAAGLLAVEGDRLVFAHPLFASAVRDRAPAAARRAVHARLAEVEPEPEARARHLGLATLGPDGVVADALEVAAHDARARGATEVASELLRVAVVRTPPTDDAARWRRAVLLGDVLLEAGDLEAAATWLDLQIPVLPAGADRARARLTRSVVHWYADGGAAASAAVRAAVPDAGDDPVLLGTIHSRLAIFSESDTVAARDHGARAVAELRRCGESDLLGSALCNLFYYEVLTGAVPRPDLLEEGLRLEDPRGSTDRSTTPGFWYLATDAWDLARERFRTTLEQERARGDLSSEPDLLSRLGEVEQWYGDWPAARRYAEAAETSARENGSDASYQPSGRLLLMLDLLEGRLEEAEATARARADAFEAAGHRLAVVSYLAAATFARASAADHRGVLATTARAAAHLEAIGLAEPLGRLDPAPERLAALVALGELDEAEQLLAAVGERLRRVPRPWLAAAHLRAAAALAAARGDLAGAVELTEPAADGGPGQPFEQARTLLVRGRLLRRARRSGDADRCLERAGRVFDDLGAAAWSAQVAQELGRSRRRGDDPTALTATERRVAELAAGGATNKEVATALHMSPKTVEVHLTRLYRKLGIRSRAELGSVVGSGGL